MRRPVPRFLFGDMNLLKSLGIMVAAFGLIAIMISLLSPRMSVILGMPVNAPLGCTAPILIVGIALFLVGHLVDVADRRALNRARGKTSRQGTTSDVE